MNIVKGLLFHYTTKELSTMMNARADYHDQRANTKESTLPDLRKALETVKANTPANDVAQMTKFLGNDRFNSKQDEALENEIRDHRNKALVFRTLAKHLVPDATYELYEDDLRRLEIVK